MVGQGDIRFPSSKLTLYTPDEGNWSGDWKVYHHLNLSHCGLRHEWSQRSMLHYVWTKRGGLIQRNVIWSKMEYRIELLHK